MNRILFTIVLAAILVLLSGFFTRQETTVTLDRDDNGKLYSLENPGGGVAYVETNYGFPMNFISNPEPSLTYEVVWYKMAINFIFWFTILISMYNINKRLHK